MERIERKKNPQRKKIFRWIVPLAVVVAVVYGYTRIPYFVVRQNLTLQNNYTYETYDAVLEKRSFYLTKEYYERFQSYHTVLERIRYIKEHKESCRMLSLKLGKRNTDGSIPYTAVYELSYEDGETPSQTIHIEGVQHLERFALIWWKVSENGTTHSCTDLNAEEAHSH